MKKLLGLGAVVLGACGALVCATAIGLGWWAAVKGTDRVNRVSARLDDGLAQTDARLSRVEVRLAAVRVQIDEVWREAEQLSAENAELPRVRAAIEQLLDRLIATIDRAAALADSLRTVAAGLRAAEDVVAGFSGQNEPPGRGRAAADAIDRAAEVLDVPRVKAEAAKSAQAVRLARALLALAGEVAAGSERLAEGLAGARREVAAAREGTAAWRDKVVFWAYVAAAALSLVAAWAGLGQLCLIRWGHRRFTRPGPAKP